VQDKCHVTHFCSRILMHVDCDLILEVEC